MRCCTIVGFADCGGGGGRGEVVEEDRVEMLLFPGNEGDVIEEASWSLRPLDGGGSSDEGFGGTSRPCISAASFSSVALRSATRSAMRASKSLSSKSFRDACKKKKNNIF